MLSTSGNILMESIIIEGTVVLKDIGRTKFSLPMRVCYNPETMSLEAGIIKSMKSQARSFIELCVEQNWHDTNWTYTSI